MCFFFFNLRNISDLQLYLLDVRMLKKYHVQIIKSKL